MDENTAQKCTGEEMPKLDIVTVCFALGSEVRWPAISLLADGRSLTSEKIAGVLGREVEGVARHMKVLLNAGVVECFTWKEDLRVRLYRIPAVFRQTPGRLDFGVCSVRVAGGSAF